MSENLIQLLLQKIVNYIPLAVNIISKFFLLIMSFAIVCQGQEIAKLERPRVVVGKSSVNIEVMTELEQRAFRLSNKERLLRKLPELKWNEDLAKLARLHSGNMAKYDFFSHRGIDGLMVDDRAESLGLTSWVGIGENIAFNRGFENPAEFTVEKWMLSSSHRNNLLSKKWQESAVGVVVRDDETYYFTQVFIYRY